MTKQLNKVLKTISNFIWRIFLTGLITILPLTLTIALFNVAFKVLVRWLQPLKYFEPAFLERIPYAELIIAFTIIIAFGMLINIFLLDRIIHFVESLIFKVPLIRPVYSGIKQLVHAFNPQDTVSFKEVVLVEFPRAGIYSLGFVTSELSTEISPEKDKEFLNIFIPTTPNPTTGYFIMAQKKDVHIIQISRQEAMAMIISGGIIQPDHLINNKNKK